MKLTQLGKFLAFGFASLSILAACGNDEGDRATENDESAQLEEVEVKTVTVAFADGSEPSTYVDEDGNATGYDVEVMKLVDEKLEDYEFKFVATSDEELLSGVEQGKYDVGVKNAFQIEGQEDRFLYPEEFIGLSSAGIILQSKNEHIQDLKDFATAELTLAPVAENSVQYTIVEQYNEQYPANRVYIKEELDVDQIEGVRKGRVDGAITIEADYTAHVLHEASPYYQYKDDLVYNEFLVLKTWPLFNKQQTDFAKAYDEAMKELKETDELSKLIEEFYGKDLFSKLDDEE